MPITVKDILEGYQKYNAETENDQLAAMFPDVDFKTSGDRTEMSPKANPPGFGAAGVTVPSGHYVYVTAGAIELFASKEEMQAGRLPLLLIDIPIKANPVP